MTALSELGSHPGEAKTAEAACIAAASTLEAHGRDIPFALIYLTEADGGHARLAATAGVEACQDISPERVDLELTSGAWPWADTKLTMQPQVVAGLARGSRSSRPSRPALGPTRRIPPWSCRSVPASRTNLPGSSSPGSAVTCGWTTPTGAFWTL